MDEKETILEIAEHIENKSDSIDPIRPHNGKIIDQIIVSQDTSYAVTYSGDDNSIVGWLVNVEENGQQQQSDVYFKLDRPEIDSFVLYKKILLFRYRHNYNYRKYLF